MEKIDIQNFKKYYRNDDGNGTLARVGHVNYVIETLSEEIAEAVTRDYVAETGLTAVSGLNKINNYNVTIQGIELDVYAFQAITELAGSNAYVIPIGYITTSSSNVDIISNSSNVLALDSVLQEVATSLGVSALVTETSTGDAIPVSFMGINLDNTVTTPDEYYIFLVAGDLVPFECTIAINLELAMVADSTVEYNVI
jgi:hypothetical protein